LRSAFLCWAAIALSPFSASQALSGLVIGAGYSVQQTVDLAPGQVISIFTDRISNQVTQPVLASSNPLPYLLGGVSASLKSNRSHDPLSLPILALRPLSACFRPTPDCAAYVAVTVQVPLGISVNIPGVVGPPITAILSIADGGPDMPGMDAFPVPDSIHVLSGCDLGIGKMPCDQRRLVKHQDGSIVDVSRPAVPGEELTVDLFGAGATVPPVPAGQLTPEGVFPAKGKIDLLFDFQPNAAGRACREPAFCSGTPAQAVLKPGRVGLYEVRSKSRGHQAESPIARPRLPGFTALPRI
jgi:uncharacterized protein (TIGR03437 family)